MEFNKAMSLKYKIIILLLCIVCAMFLGLKLGYLNLSYAELFTALQQLLFGDETNSNTNIILKLRLPRVVLACCVGMGLTMSGIVMQAIIRNPLADPYILGISAGASAGATGAIFLGLGKYLGGQAISISAFIGAIIASFVVINISRKNNNGDISMLLLTGVAVAAVCSGISGFFSFVGRNKEGMEAVTFWLMGSVANAKLSNVLVLLVIVLFALVYFFCHARILNLMLVGQEQAVTLGVDLRKYARKFMIVNSVVVGVIVYNAGLIGFVGLVVPHFVRLLSGTNHKHFLPVGMLFGGFIAVVVDILSRTIFNGVEIPLGVAFAIIGAPCFIYVLVRKQYRVGDR